MLVAGPAAPAAPPARVVAAVLSQHDHDQLVDCLDPWACEFEQGHLVVYAALNSHANFAHPTNGTIFGGVRNDFHTSLDGSMRGVPGLGAGTWQGMEGVVVLDRAARGAKWAASPANLVLLPQMRSKEGAQGTTAAARETGSHQGLGGRGRRSLQGNRHGDAQQAKGGSRWGERDRAWVQRLQRGGRWRMGGYAGLQQLLRGRGRGEVGSGKEAGIKAGLTADDGAWAAYPGFW